MQSDDWDRLAAESLPPFEGQIARMVELAEEKQGGFLTSRSSVARRRALRHRVHHELRRHLVAVAEGVATKQPGLAEQFTVPSGMATNEAFRTFARKMLE